LQEEALGGVVAQLPDNLELRVGLDSFGDHVEIVRSRHGDDRAYDGFTHGCGRDTSHERTIDLDDVEG